jgi:hypothetical protein
MIGRKNTQIGGIETRFDDEETFLWEVVEIVSGNLMGSFTTEQEAIEFATKIANADLGSKVGPGSELVNSKATCPQGGDKTTLVPSTGVCQSCTDSAYDRYCPR